MTTLVKVLAAVGVFAPGLQAIAPLSNDATTETFAPQEFGSMTVAGSLVYSMNVCTVVHSTSCQVSQSTGPAVDTTAYDPIPTSVGGSGETTTTTIEDGGHWTEPISTITSNENAGTTGGPGSSTENTPTTGSGTDSLSPTASVTNKASSSKSATGSGAQSSGTGTATQSAPPSEETAAATHVSVSALMIGLMIACLV